MASAWASSTPRARSTRPSWTRPRQASWTAASPSRTRSSSRALTETSPPTTEAAELALELRGIVERFGSLTANDGVDLELRRGEIHALLGENGAGKSTLMNIVYGMLRPDAGEVRIDGEPVSIASPRDAMAHGVGMVFQHFMLIPVMT